MKTIFRVDQFKFPYQYKFPGQSTDERILYATRENRLMLVFRQVFVLLIALIIFITGTILQQAIQEFLGIALSSLFQLAVIGLTLLFLAIGWWWVTALWKKSIAIVTTKRLTKFVYTTPASRYSLILPLDQIVDTGAYTKGFAQAALKLGTFVARSSAASSGAATDDPSRVNKKYFYIENVKRAEDLQHYISKLLDAFRRYPDKLKNFRPFIPHLKGEDRASFIRNHFPQFWS